MNAKEAIVRAKTSLADIFAEEAIQELSLEEIRYDEAQDQWLITIGFLRPAPHGNAIAAITGQPRYRSSVKVVTLNDHDGKVVAVTNRGEEPAYGQTGSR